MIIKNFLLANDVIKIIFKVETRYVISIFLFYLKRPLISYVFIAKLIFVRS